MSKPKGLNRIDRITYLYGLNRIDRITYLYVREIDPSFDNSPPTEILR